VRWGGSAWLTDVEVELDVCVLLLFRAVVMRTAFDSGGEV